MDKEIAPEIIKKKRMRRFLKVLLHVSIFVVVLILFIQLIKPGIKRSRIRTSVCIRSIEVEEAHTRIDLFQTGWGSSAEWQQVY